MKGFFAWLREWPVYWRRKRWFYSKEHMDEIVDFQRRTGMGISLGPPTSPMSRVQDRINLWLSFGWSCNDWCEECMITPIVKFGPEVAERLMLVRVAEDAYKIRLPDGRFLKSKQTFYTCRQRWVRERRRRGSEIELYSFEKALYILYKARAIAARNYPLVGSIFWRGAEGAEPPPVGGEGAYLVEASADAP